MVIKREVAYGIVQGLSDFWKSEELQDFTVTLGTTKFGCHRFLLAACSGFFRGLFRSGMKETELKCVTVEDISSETFDLILETLYTGHGVLTNDNVIDIWRAAHQLQIMFLIKECEDFVIDTLSLENYIKYFKLSRLLNSEPVTKVVGYFIVRNSSHFFKTNSFLKLSRSNVLNLITCQDLVADSEDDVIYAILRWVQFTSQNKIVNQKGKCSDNSSTNLDVTHTSTDVHKEDTPDQSSTQTKNERSCKTLCKENLPHEDITSESPFKAQKMIHFFSKPDTRVKDLFDLLSKARLCLASHHCLEMIISHPLVRPHEKTRDLIVRALFYKLQAGKRNGQWPTGAIFRNNDIYANSALTYTKDNKNIFVKTFLFSRNSWLSLPKLVGEATFSSIQFVVLDKTLYALGHLLSIYDSKIRASNSQNRTPISIMQLNGGSWSDKSSTFTLPSSVFSAVESESFIYVFSPKGKEVWKLDPTTGTHDRMSDLPDECGIWYVMSHEHLILVFYSCSNNGVDETAIDCFDTRQNSWRRLSNLEGSVKDIVSLKDDHSTYLLQSSGDLWKLVQPQSDVVDFEHVVKLWSCNWPLHGAVTFMDDLYIYGVKDDNFSNDPKLRKSVDGLFQNIIYKHSKSNEKSIFMPYIVQRTEIKRAI
ncbi:kelch-like protein 41 [Biomphalaria glabrata]|uniref:Kelch-like protein 41 n=1 Tax=Biomphalaria glabrata TaxID=6526 RepID=A0A9W2Z244_BIOGL|nr:kelch-like protein 41 [Biomphalaria glabrata]